VNHTGPLIPCAFDGIPKIPAGSASTPPARPGGLTK